MEKKTRILGSKLAREITEAERVLVVGARGDQCGGLCTTPGSDDYHL